MKTGDVIFEQLSKSRQRIFRVIDLKVVHGPTHPYKDIVGLLRRIKSDRRSAVGKARPEYTWEVHLEKEPVRRFYDEAEAKAWVTAVLKLD